MQTVTSLQEPLVAPGEFDASASETMTLEQIRIVRQLLVTRCGALALIAILIGALVPGFSMTARVGSVALIVIAPVWVWITELRMEHRLSKRFDQIL